MKLDERMRRSAIKVLELTTDVAGRQYERLVRGMLESQHSFSLVWRSELRHTDAAWSIRSDLAHVEVEHQRTDRWPGSRLVGGKATVVHFRCDRSVLPVLMRPGSLYSWSSPAFPEDLAFYGETGDPVLASVAHEREGWVFGSLACSWVGRVTTLAAVNQMRPGVLDILLGR